MPPPGVARHESRRSVGPCKRREAPRSSCQMASRSPDHDLTLRDEQDRTAGAVGTFGVIRLARSMVSTSASAWTPRSSFVCRSGAR